MYIILFLNMYIILIQCFFNSNSNYKIIRFKKYINIFKKMKCDQNKVDRRFK